MVSILGIQLGIFAVVANIPANTCVFSNVSMGSTLNPSAKYYIKL